MGHGKGFLAALELTFKGYPETEFKFGSRTKQLSGETRAWGLVGGNQRAGYPARVKKCQNRPFSLSSF